MKRFSQFLIDLLPRTGRVITEDGGFVNTGDVARDAQDISRAIKSIPLEHSKVHEGKAYISEFMVYLSGTVAQHFIFDTGPGIIHMKELDAVPDNDEVVAAMFEDTVSTGGDPNGTFVLDGISGLAIAPKPSNRINQINCGCRVLINPTIVSQGTDHVFLKFMPGEEGTGQRTSGSADREDWERVLKPETRYHLYVRRLAGTGTTRVKIKLRYYIV